MNPNKTTTVRIEFIRPSNTTTVKIKALHEKKKFHFLNNYTSSLRIKVFLFRFLDLSIHDINCCTELYIFWWPSYFLRCGACASNQYLIQNGRSSDMGRFSIRHFSLYSHIPILKWIEKYFHNIQFCFFVCLKDWCYKNGHLLKQKPTNIW